jgi:hypothetical protein
MNDLYYLNVYGFNYPDFSPLGYSIQKALDECKTEDEKQQVRLSFVLGIILSFIALPMMLGLAYVVSCLARYM